jgi:hypothetical protein
VSLRDVHAESVFALRQPQWECPILPNTQTLSATIAVDINHEALPTTRLHPPFYFNLLVRSQILDMKWLVGDSDARRYVAHSRRVHV